MNVGFVIIYGAMVGFITSKVRGSGFGMGWDIYLGIAGSTFASLIMIYAYFMNMLPMRDVLGMNLFSIAVDIAGALALIYSAWFLKRSNSNWQMG